MSSKRNRRKDRSPAAKTSSKKARPAPGSIRQAWGEYRLMWGPAGETLSLHERLDLTWRLLFALRWFVAAILIGVAFLVTRWMFGEFSS